MNDTKMLIIMGVIFIVFVILIGCAIFFIVKKNAKINEDTSIEANAETAQSFLPFKDIKDSMFDLGNYEYRAYIECESINYDLKTAQEQEMIDASFQRFLDSLTFDITIHIQTKTIDNKRTLKLLENDMVKTVKEYNHLYDYANAYLTEMATLHQKIGNTKQKKKYIIVPFDESSLLTYSNDEEKYIETLKGMRHRCQVVMDGLASIGVKTRILTSIEIAEMIYSTYHRDNYSDIEQIIRADYMELIVDGNNAIEKMDKKDKTLWIINECENRLKTEILTLQLSDEEKEKALKALDSIIEIKKDLQ